jgi:hypothetical protein
VAAYVPPGYHQHDGFYLNLRMGGGYLTTTESYHGQSATASGGGFAFTAAFGGVITPNLILYGEMLGIVVENPTVSQGGSSQTRDGVSMTMVGFGPGLAYYVEPVNAYFSATFTLSQLSASSTNTDTRIAESEMGVGFSMSAGKEWWISTDWGLGAAFQFQFASMKDKYSDAQLTGLGFVVLFSATYN